MANSHHPLVLRNPTISSNTTPSADDDSRATRRCAKPRCFGDSARRERRLDFGSATRNSTPQATRTEPAWKLQKSWETRKKCDIPREKHGFAAEDKGFELSPNSQGNQRNLASLVINPTQERHVDAWIRLVNALGYIDDERIIALAEHVENVRGIAEQNV